RVFLVVASVNSTAAIVYYLTRSLLPDRVAFSGEAFLAYLLTVSVIGLVVAGGRYRKMASADPSVTAPPARHELPALLARTWPAPASPCSRGGRGRRGGGFPGGRAFPRSQAAN